MFRHFVKRPLKTKSLSIRPIGCHRVNRICNHDYPCADRNSLTGQAVRVARAIIILMMVTNVRLHTSSEFRNRSREVSAANRMSLHQHPLFRCKPSRLTKKGCKVLMYLADIMQECRCPYLIDVFGMQSKFARDLTCILGNSDRVAGCIGITSLNGLDHQLKELPVDALDLKVHLVHMTNKEQRQNHDCQANELKLDVEKRQE